MEHFPKTHLTMPAKERIALSDAYAVLAEVVHGLSLQPKFSLDGGCDEFNAAGAELDDLRMDLERRRASSRREDRNPVPAMSPALHHDISKLGHAEMLALWEVCRAVTDTLNLHLDQGRFQAGYGRNGGVIWNGAGKIIEDMAQPLYGLMDAIEKRARALPAPDRSSQERRLELLIRSEIRSFECTIEEAEQAFNLIDSEREGETA